MNIKFLLQLFVSLMFIYNPVTAQTGKEAKDQDIAYTKVITQRANKIVDALHINDSSIYHKVSKIIADQYRTLNTYHEQRDATFKEIKKEFKDAAELEKENKAYEKKSDKKLSKIHSKYIGKLSKELTDQQVDQVKDGMTYGVLPITLKGYHEMLPNLTEAQKTQIKAYLIEAREHAMDAPSSEKKHAWFGKYKGKINNYLSAQGIDMKKAGLAWEKRIKEAKNKK